MEITSDSWTWEPVNTTEGQAHAQSNGALISNGAFVLDVFIRSLSTVLILTSNALTIFSILRFASLQTVSNTFILSLSIADFLNGTSLLPFPFIRDIPSDLLVRCLASFFLTVNSLTVYVSLITLIAIAVDRFLALVYPLSYKITVTMTRARLVCAAIWIFATVVIFSTNGYYMVIRNIEVLRKPLSLATLLSPLAFILLVEVSVLVFLLIAVLVYARIFVALYQRSRKIDQAQARDLPTQAINNATSRPVASNSQLQNRRITRMMVLVLLVMILSWVPFYVVVLGLQTQMRQGKMWAFYVYRFALYSLNVNSFFNPLIYAWQSPQFRKAFYIVLFGKCATRNTGETIIITSSVKTKSETL